MRTITAFKRRSASDKAESDNTSNNDIETDADSALGEKTRKKRDGCNVLLGNGYKYITLLLLYFEDYICRWLTD